MGLFRILKQLFAGPGVNLSPQASRDDSVSPSAINPGNLHTPLVPGDGNEALPSTQPATASTMLAGLDADQFQPLSTAEALDQTKVVGWQTAYWDPLNVIPPADLPRIQVIDRTMVGMGLLSAEDLARIHAVGEEMAKHKTDHQAIWHAGEQAVALNRSQREQRKAEKKAEAEKRKRLRAEQISRRRANDIVYLGRGVSRGLADRRVNVEALQKLHLPVLATPKDVADAMGIAIGQLRWLAFHNPAATRIHYVRFTVPKRSGGVRELASPHEKLATAQRWILDNVLKHLPSHDAAHGFVQGRGIRTNAEKHIKSTLVINADLVDFFPSIDFARVEGLFRRIGFSPAVSTIFALLCTESPRVVMRYAGQTVYAATGNRVLPQGACTSPAISNLIAKRLDSRLLGISRRLGWRYTRYADDMTLSTHSATDKIGYLMARLRHITAEEGFMINESKTRVQRPNMRQCVTGVVVNDKVSIDRRTIRRLRAILHRAKSEGLEAQNREDHPNFAMWVSGMIAYVEMINASQGAKLRRSYEAI